MRFLLFGKQIDRAALFRLAIAITRLLFYYFFAACTNLSSFTKPFACLSHPT